MVRDETNSYHLPPTWPPLFLIFPDSPPPPAREKITISSPVVTAAFIKRLIVEKPSLSNGFLAEYSWKDYTEENFRSL